MYLHLCKEKRAKLMDSLVKMAKEINKMSYNISENELSSKESIDFEDNMKDYIKEFVKTLEE